jgi:hypothetical protein
MSTKTTFKRVALVTVAALGFGLLSSVTPASAATSTGLVASVGPNGQTSLTVVGGTDSTTAALVRLDVTVDSATSATGHGLQAGESITATVTGVPTSVTAKTVAANGGSLADTGTSWTTVGYSDFVMVDVKQGAAGGTVAGTAATSSSLNTNWALLANGDFVTTTNWDTNTSWTAAQRAAQLDDGLITSLNTGYTNMDTIHEVTGTKNTKSYYVSINPRAGATVMNQGVYTFSFQLTDAYGIVRATKTVSIDFVSAESKSDAVLALATSGTFLASTALGTVDSATADGYAKLTMTNRSGGLVRTNTGAAPAPLVQLQKSTTAAPVYVDSPTVTIEDAGTYNADFGDVSATSPGNGTLQSQDGVYGIKTTFPHTASSTTTGALVSYQFWAGYGNATIVTKAITIYPASGAGTATAAKTDAQVTATGMSAANQLKISNDTDASYTWTLPTSTTTGSIKFWIADSTDTATPSAAITVTPTWSGSHGSSAVTPATSTTGTVYTTDSGGNFTVSFSNTSPVAGATLTLVLSGGAAFGAATYTATIAWAKPTATTITVADPITGVYVTTGSTNVTTVLVSDQFGNPVSGQSVQPSITGTTSANYSATTAIAPITTGATGTATYSLVGGATTGTKDTLSFQCVPTDCGTAAPMVYNYVTTVPVVATMVASYGTTWGTAATLVPSTGIYSSGTTAFTIKNARDLSKALTSAMDTSATDDQISLSYTALTSAGVSATGAVVTVTAGDGAHIVGATGLPVKSRNFVVGASGVTAFNVLATGTGAVTWTATSGAVSTAASAWIDNATADARFVKITAAATGTANGSGVPVTVTVTDRNGNAVSGVSVNVVASGVGSFMGGSITNSFVTDASGTYTFLANTIVSEGGVAKFTATSGTTADFSSAAGYVGATAVDSTLAAGNSSASHSITFAAGASASDVAQTATDAAAEATDAANAATDAANAAAEAADAATAAAQDAADAVAALSAQVATLISGLKSQLTALTNLVIKIQKKVKA